MTLSQLKADQKNGIEESKSRTRKCKEEPCGKAGLSWKASEHFASILAMLGLTEKKKKA